MIEQLDVKSMSEVVLAEIRQNADRIKLEHKDTKVVADNDALLEALASLRKFTWPLSEAKVTYMFDSGKGDESDLLTTRGDAVIRPDGSVWVGEVGGAIIDAPRLERKLFGERGFTFEFFVRKLGGQPEEKPGQVLAIEGPDARGFGIYQVGRRLIVECLMDGEMRRFPFGELDGELNHVSIAYDEANNQVRGAINGRMALTVDADMSLNGLALMRIVFGGCRTADRPWRGSFDSVLIYGAAQIPGNFERHYQAAKVWQETKATP